MFVLLLVMYLSIQAVVIASVKVSKSKNIEQVFKNERLFDAFADCLLDEKPCSSEEQKLKGIRICLFFFRYFLI